jgi:hypothetical protein
MSFFIALSDCIAMLSDMNDKLLQLKIERIKREIAELGPLRPGTLYSRHSECGKPGCHCRRERNPVKHGPYHYLSFTFQGRSYTEFVPARQLQQVRKEVSNYNRLMNLVKLLVESSIKLARLRKGK